MAKVVVPAGTKVTTDRGDTGTLAQAWDGTSLRVVINSDKRGRIEAHPSNVYVNGRSLRDMAGGGSMAADASNAVEFGFADNPPEVKKEKEALWNVVSKIAEGLWAARTAIQQGRRAEVVRKYPQAASRLTQLEKLVNNTLEAIGPIANPLEVFKQDAVEAVHFTAQADHRR